MMNFKKKLIRGKNIRSPLDKAGKRRFPTKHAKEPEDIPGNIRFAVKWSYKILFTIGEKHVNIVRIFHAAQSPRKLKDL
ncbi:MAG: type II toxin-antitoxin system RelE/ParE family toxin [Tannerellaceae bacterium]|jgi:plasmid stabilization system protein ParE|nr:type II toxin-antitoxin system RelE/ParE family toxin [Tannerellaceae bacterium]